VEVTDVELINWIKSWDSFLAVIISVFTIIGVAVPLLRRWHRNSSAFKKKVEAGMDSLLGYGPITDPATGAILKEATPSLAIRVDKIETAILSLAETQRQIVEINSRLTNMEEWREQHQAWSDSIHPHPPQIVQNFGSEHQ
jgi:hypothetical protein